jgi:hypothetical protein
VVELRFLGPQHDRRIHLRYTGISQCNFGNPGPQEDMLIHELREIVSGVFVHEFLFASAATLLIEFSGLSTRFC